MAPIKFSRELSIKIRYFDGVELSFANKDTS